MEIYAKFKKECASLQTPFMSKQIYLMAELQQSLH